MNEDVFNMSIRKFLKKVGVTSQREIEGAIRAGLAGGQLPPLKWEGSLMVALRWSPRQ